MKVKCSCLLVAECGILCFAILCGCSRPARESPVTKTEAKPAQEQRNPAEPLTGDHASILIEQVPHVLVDPSKNTGKYVNEVLSIIAKSTNKLDRTEQYKRFMRSACTVRLDELPSLTVEDGTGNDETKSRDAAIRLSNAHGTLVKIAEEVWSRLYLDDVPGVDLFDPWFSLIEKLKDESVRLNCEDTALYASRVDHVERLFNLFYIEDRRHAPSRQDIEKVRERFLKVVGRPIRNKEQYLSGSGGEVPRQ